MSGRIVSARVHQESWSHTDYFNRENLVSGIDCTSIRGLEKTKGTLGLTGSSSCGKHLPPQRLNLQNLEAWRKYALWTLSGTQSQLLLAPLELREGPEELALRPRGVGTTGSEGDRRFVLGV